MLVNYVAIFGGSSREDLISKLVFFVANMWLFFKVWRHGWQFNSMRSMHHLLLVSIAWHIRVTWQCNHSWTYHWLWRSMPCCIYIYIYIFLTLLEEAYGACKVDKKNWNKVGRSFIMLRLENLDACTYQTCFAILKNFCGQNLNGW
jgi:hypothetical protein